MDPLTRSLLMTAGGETPAVQVGTVLWQGTNNTSVTLTSGSDTYSVSGTSSGGQTYGDTVPSVTTTGWYLDVELLQGYSSYVGWLGVCNTTTSFAYNASPRPYTGWYWSGAIWYPGGTDSTNLSALTADTYRIAMRSESGTPKIYFRKLGGAIRGPIDVPTGTLRLMMLGQNNFTLPEATILNSGAVYEGGGGLF
jgi:hypothetical protein